MTSISKTVLAACLLATVAGTAAAAPTNAPAAPGMEAMLKETGFDFTKRENGYKVFVSIDGENSMVAVQERGIGTEDELKMIHIFTPVIEVPKGFKHSPALLKKIAELNDGMLVGKLSIDTDNGDIWFASSFWLRTADAKTMGNELALAHFTRLDMRKELMPFVKE